MPACSVLLYTNRRGLDPIKIRLLEQKGHNSTTTKKRTLSSPFPFLVLPLSLLREQQMSTYTILLSLYWTPTLTAHLKNDRRK